ncbi:MAG TPA: glycosyltransferase family 2 protein [Bacteroidetes bacterium]|nr:glycosyltransferase family 2 protein [Bacteroidota bacterium]
MDLIPDYLANKTLSDELFADTPERDTGIIVIIPAFDEPGIISALESLRQCKRPPCKVELIVLVNAPGQADKAQIEQNKITCSELSDWGRRNNDNFFKLLFHDTGLRDGRWGVGMARKMAMDEALRRFCYLDNLSGVIVSLDADCLVSDNYFREIYEELYMRSDRKACSIYFEHPLSGALPAGIYDAIARYELHLRYYFQALKYAGFPWVFHTLGSAIAVKAEAYARAGGMSKRQGAEDFYFIQKMIPAGGYFNLSTATVMPSPRISGRVPFGTGPMMAKLAKADNEYLTYNISGFDYLKELFDKLMAFYESGSKTEGKIYCSLHESLRKFLEINDWSNKIVEIRNNTSSPASFKKRFFNWFNMFRLVKYLNFTHTERYLDKIPVQEAAALLLEKTGRNIANDDVSDLLRIFREMER